MAKSSICALNLVILVVVALQQLQVVTSLSCSPCDPASCPTLRCPGGTARDPCGCCRVCAKQQQDKCGGMFKSNGQCDQNLTCVIQPNNGDLLTESEIGICKPTHSLTSSDKCHQTSYFGCDIVNRRCDCSLQIACSNPFQYQTLEQCNLHRFASTSTSEKCKQVKCRVQQSRNCPQDSVLVEGFVAPGKCCPSPSRCGCKPEKCTYNLCPPNTRRVLVNSGTNRPGSCCDIYRCTPQPNEVDCTDVECPIPSLGPITCPSDSMAIAADTCCPGVPVCQCPEQQCRRPKCSNNQRLRVAYRGNGQPGSCCDEYTCTNDAILVGCSVNGTRHQHGSSYKMGKCRLCECKMGVSSCGPIACPDLSTCTRVTMNQGDCCPTCLDRNEKDNPSPFQPYPLCKSDDDLRTFVVGETWSTDPCTHCTCAEGGVTKCTASFCQEPVLVTATQTCPSPSSCSLTDFDCHFGFEYDEQGCRMCQCKTDVEGCGALTDCALHCPRGFVADKAGCDTCQCRQRKCKELTTCRKQCPFGYKLNKKGCDRCKCRRCAPLNSCDKQCRFGFAENNYGCPVCKCKASLTNTVAPRLDHLSQSCNDVLTGGRRDDGETWSSGCHVCICRGGDVLCDVIHCPVPQCDKPVFEEGACCATCQDTDPSLLVIPRSLSCIEADGDRFVEGDTWSVDRSTSCTCHSGHVMCTSKVCPPTPCANPVYDEALSCSMCPEASGTPLSTKSKSCQNDAGTIYESGDTFRTDLCTSCLCVDGVIKCFNEQCPQAPPCENPVLKKGMCCPQCLGHSPSSRSCNDSGKIREHAQEWNKTSDGCTRCSCFNGSVTCRPPECAPIPTKCRRIYRLPESCCEECVKEETDPPFVTFEYPDNDATDITPIAVGITLACILVATLVLLGICIKRHCVHSQDKYTRGSPAANSRQSHMINKSSSLRSGSTGTARTIVVSSSSEDERTFRGGQ